MGHVELVRSLSNRIILLTCLKVAPAVQRFAREYPHAVFAKVDVDAQRQIASTYQITAMYVIQQDKLILGQHLNFSKTGEKLTLCVVPMQLLLKQKLSNTTLFPRLHKAVEVPFQ